MNLIQTTAKLYDARDFVRRMTTPDEYQRRITEYQGYIRRGAEKWKVSDLEAMMVIAGELRDEPIAQAGIFAAYVELVEAPSVGDGNEEQSAAPVTQTPSMEGASKQ